MSSFIEVNKTGDRTIINLNSIKKVVPVINGVGCVIHFEQGTLNVIESYDTIKSLMIQENAPVLLTEEAPSPKKKNP